MLIEVDVEVVFIEQMCYMCMVCNEVYCQFYCLLNFDFVMYVYLYLVGIDFVLVLGYMMVFFLYQCVQYVMLGECVEDY